MGSMGVHLRLRKNRSCNDRNIAQRDYALVWVLGGRREEEKGKNNSQRPNGAEVRTSYGTWLHKKTKWEKGVVLHL